MLGAAVEGASGGRFLDYLQKHVFEPARMEHIRLDDVYAVVPHRAHGYARTIDGAIRNCALADTSNKIPGGGFIATAEDLVRFVVALDSGKLVSAETRAKMYTPQKTRDGKPVPYGIGWSVLDSAGQRWVCHAGAQPGASAFLLASPDGNVIVSVLANLEGVELGPLALRIALLVVQGDN